jgi:RNA recognition motif-containing protein
MGKKLFIGNLSHDVDPSALGAIFKAHGTVESAAVITDRTTGESKGYGFVEMSSDAEAQAAITAVNGQDCGGRALTVAEAKPRQARPYSAGRSGGGNPSGAGRSRS